MGEVLTVRVKAVCSLRNSSRPLSNCFCLRLSPSSPLRMVSFSPIRVLRPRNSFRIVFPISSIRTSSGVGRNACLSISPGETAHPRNVSIQYMHLQKVFAHWVGIEFLQQSVSLSVKMSPEGSHVDSRGSSDSLHSSRCARCPASAKNRYSLPTYSHHLCVTNRRNPQSVHGPTQTTFLPRGLPVSHEFIDHASEDERRLGCSLWNSPVQSDVATWFSFALIVHFCHILYNTAMS